MALLETPKFSASKLKTLQIEEPCKGGINLNDLEYEQEVNQSPNVLNMMYRNGAFGKRYGQKYYRDFEKTIYAVAYFKGNLIVHAGTRIYKDDEVIATGMEEKRGLFIHFNRKLYYLNGKFYVFDESWEEVDPYIPDVVINAKPDMSYGDTMDQYNAIGAGFKNIFNGDGTSTEYKLATDSLDVQQPIIEIIGKGKLEDDEYTVNYQEGKITFNEAPPEGQNNVEITAYKTEQKYIDRIMNCKYYATYGGTNNSYLFLAGGGDSCFYYSDTADATYFPELNSFRVGNSEEDITGFGEQYDVLMVFKPTEIFGIEYYTSEDGEGRFSSKQINPTIGCDAPDSIQLIDNLLTWLSTVHGVCTLVSTNIEDERNVRIISRNVDGGHRVAGLLQEENLQNAVATDYQGKYFLVANERAYVWDYSMSPYSNTGNIDADAKRLSWFLFDNFNVGLFVQKKHDLLYSMGSKLVILTNEFNDFGGPIQAKYQTPYLQFNATYLKTIKNMYVQCRADTASVINITYFTEETPNGEKEPESITVSGRLYDSFLWNAFSWSTYNMANVFRRKCSLKKIQMASVRFENNEVDRDMSMSHLAFDYEIVKNIK